MKASLTFRDEKNPLVRMKFPVTVAGLPLTSGIALGEDQDLCVHLGTSAEKCPSVKIAYRPNLPSSSLSLIVKAGIGPWGAPRAAALCLSAEVMFSRVASGPFFSVHVKPRLGDFCFRKMARLASFNAVVDAPTPRLNKEGCSHSEPLSKSPRQGCSESFHGSALEVSHVAPTVEETGHGGIFDDAEVANKHISGSGFGFFGDAPALTPLHLDKKSLFTPMPYRGQPFNRIPDEIPEEGESMDNWGNDFVKIEDFDSGNRSFQEENINFTSKGHDVTTSHVDNYKDRRLHSKSPRGTSAGGGSCIDKPDSALTIKTADSLPERWRWGVDESNRRWSLRVHSSLPLGSHTALKFRWGVNANHDFLQRWDSRLPHFKLPYLYLQKVSILSKDVALESCKQRGFNTGAQLPLLPESEEIHELSPVAALCSSIKSQLQLLHAENQVLKRTMEEMKVHFEQRSSVVQRGKEVNSGDMYSEDMANGLPADVKNDSKEFRGKNYYEKERGSRQSHGHDGLDALKKFSGLGRGGNGK